MYFGYDDFDDVLSGYLVPRTRDSHRSPKLFLPITDNP